MKSFYSNGKLLLTGEYTVLDGALGLAVPTRYGQSLKVTETETPHLHWKSFDDKGNVWFDTVFEFEGPALTKKKTDPIRKTLAKILAETKKLNPNFLNGPTGFEVETKLDFPRSWGLGTSSTLINNIAQWAEVDAYELLGKTFGGSGYDIACAQHNSPILYRLKNDFSEVKEINFDPSFKDRLYFIHLNKKQDSREGIHRYKNQEFDKPKVIEQISEITKGIIQSSNQTDFERLINKHEAVLSNILKIPTVKKSLFPDYFGSIKSLGAWGGDFVLATGDEETPKYFEYKGYGTIIPYKKMVLAI